MSGAVILSEEQLQVLCSEWQRVLRLQDWLVVVRIVRKRDMKFDNSAGEAGWTPDRRDAIIRILDPLDYEPTRIYEQDMELSLVHELLHLHFALISYKDDTIEDTLQEQALHAIADGLVGLKRRLPMSSPNQMPQLNCIGGRM